MVITGKKLTASTRNSVHLLTASDRLAPCCPQAPAQKTNDRPGKEKAKRHQQWLYGMYKESQQLKHGR